MRQRKPRGSFGQGCGKAVRHPIASPPPEPIGSATSYDADIVRAHRLTPLVNEGGGRQRAFLDRGTPTPAARVCSNSRP
jgi:hypothetical protein